MGRHGTSCLFVLNGSCISAGRTMQSPPEDFLEVQHTTTNPAVHLLDPSRRRHRRSHTFTRDPGATQLCRWSLDPQALCRLQPDRRITHRLGSATESLCSKFDRRRPGEANYPCLTRFGLETDICLLCCGCGSPGLYSRSLCLDFLMEQRSL